MGVSLQLHDRMLRHSTKQSYDLQVFLKNLVFLKCLFYIPSTKHQIEAN